jgi:non-canonical purine NTP pyrophosphatase (RdgB/HAM1 family)
MKLLYITGNEGKFRAAKLILPEIEKLDIDLPEIQEINPKKIIEVKLNEANKLKRGRFMISDGSLYLEAIPGLPGPLIKWFEKTIGNQGLFQLAKKMGNFDACAKVIVGYMDDQDKISYFEGEIKGKIVEPRGSNGYGWDEIFQPKGYKKTFAEMTIEEKNKISHGRIALEKLREYLKKE